MFEGLTTLVSISSEAPSHMCLRFPLETSLANPLSVLKPGMSNSGTVFSKAPSKERKAYEIDN